ncbi:hypothetical protein ACWGCP_24555 [Streptomyces niveus]
MPGTVLTDGSSPSNGATTGGTLSTSSPEASCTTGATGATGATGVTGSVGATGGRATGPDDASGVPLPGTDAAACR